MANIISHQPDGLTISERYLNKLANQSFLSLWSYPRPFRDQQGGKEICDLLVIFQHHVLIFSDKDCDFSQTPDNQVAWNRWFKNAVWKSAEQIWGAERWIKSFPDRVFLDEKCTQPFPIEIPNASIAKFHRIVVAHGAIERCKNYFGGSGSLVIDSRIIGDAHYKRPEDGGSPFAIGQIDLSRGFVHVFDDVVLDIVFQSLDTITDFITYLEKKEAFLRSGISVFAAGEEELLGFYLMNVTKNNTHDFVLPGVKTPDSVIIREGHWKALSEHPQYRAGLAANRNSYFWDGLIEKFITQQRNGIQQYSTVTNTNEFEIAIRFMARESRFRRRILASSLLSFVRNSAGLSENVRVMLPNSVGDPYYVYVTYEHRPDMSDDRYREERRYLLYACCLAAKVRFPDATDIVGIATDPGKASSSRSEDLLYYDMREWNEEEQKFAEGLVTKHGILRSVRETHNKVYEFPEVDASS